MNLVKKVIATFLSCIVYFYSCTTYKSAPVSLQYASETKIKTKITHNTSKVSIYKYIIYEDGLYYGVNEHYRVKLRSRTQSKDTLFPNKILSVKVKDRTASTIVTIIPIAVLITVASAVIIELDNMCLLCGNRQNLNE